MHGVARGHLLVILEVVTLPRIAHRAVSECHRSASLLASQRRGSGDPCEHWREASLRTPGFQEATASACPTRCSQLGQHLSWLTRQQARFGMQRQGKRRAALNGSTLLHTLLCPPVMQRRGSNPPRFHPDDISPCLAPPGRITGRALPNLTEVHPECAKFITQRQLHLNVRVTSDRIGTGRTGTARRAWPVTTGPFAHPEMAPPSQSRPQAVMCKSPRHHDAVYTV